MTTYPNYHPFDMPTREDGRLSSPLPRLNHGRVVVEVSLECGWAREGHLQRDSSSFGSGNASGACVAVCMTFAHRSAPDTLRTAPGSAPNVCWSSASTTTCSIAGSLAWPSTIRCGPLHLQPEPGSPVQRRPGPGVLERVKVLADWRRLTTSEHFSVDGALIDAWVTHKSFRPTGDDGPLGPGRNPEVDFKGQPRANDTHASTTDPDARLFKKSEGTASRLCHMNHLLMENRNGLVVDVATTESNGKAERQAALKLLPGTPSGARRWVRTKGMTRPTSWPAAARWV